MQSNKIQIFKIRNKIQERPLILQPFITKLFVLLLKHINSVRTQKAATCPASCLLPPFMEEFYLLHVHIIFMPAVRNNRI